MTDAPRPEPLVRVHDLKKHFRLNGGRVLRAVDGVSFSIGAGSTLGLVGESGCGKTTVGRTILGLYERDGGEVIFDGQDVHEKRGRDYRALTRQMQMIFQDPHASLDPRFAVGDTVAEGLDIHRLCATKEERTARIHELLNLVGLDSEHASRFPHEFSGGQRQRIGIARALALKPRFIVCDEAISALDVSIQAQVANLLLDLQEEFDLTYLFIAHDLSMVRHLCDETAVMYVGRIVEYGKTEDVYSRPLHPYTIGLLAAVPLPDPVYERSRKRVIVRGEVPSPVNRVSGCPFRTRCSRATAICAEADPALRDMGPGHSVACHHAQE